MSLIHFRWSAIDVRPFLPRDWQKIVRGGAEGADFRDFPRTPVISREDDAVNQIPRGRVHAHQVQALAPWLYNAYRGKFLDFAREIWPDEDVSAARDSRYGVVLNVQRGTHMWFECHVDSNPITGLLFCTDHSPDDGGELVVANEVGVSGIEKVDANCTVIRPQAGHLIFFDGRRNSHYARALTKESGTRIVAIMNYYTKSAPETTRPPELNRHLYGEKELVAEIVALPRTVSPE